MLAVFLRNMQGRRNVWQFILNHKDDPYTLHTSLPRQNNALNKEEILTVSRCLPIG
jgi:hypothetical protein